MDDIREIVCDGNRSKVRVSNWQRSHANDSRIVYKSEVHRQIVM